MRAGWRSETQKKFVNTAGDGSSLITLSVDNFVQLFIIIFTTNNVCDKFTNPEIIV